jgi:YD repeat-containing protein
MRFELQRIACLLGLALPLIGAAQTCATPAARDPSPLLFNCVGGICENIDGTEASAHCPLYDGATGSGTADQFYTCSVANYYAGLAREFGQLRFEGVALTRAQPDGREVVDLVYTWQSDRNGQYKAILQSVSPRGICPSYWVLAAAADPIGTSVADLVGGSIDPASGNVHLSITDVDLSAPSGSIAFRRYYNSVDPVGLDAVPGWRHSYSRHVETVYQRPGGAYPGRGPRVSARFATPEEACRSGFAQIRGSVPAWAGGQAAYRAGVCALERDSITLGTLQIQAYPQPEPATQPREYELVRDDGRVLRYTMQGGPSAQPGVSMRLTVGATGFTVTDEENAVERYDRNGVLQSVTRVGGAVQHLFYDPAGRLERIEDSSGHALKLMRDDQGRIGSVTTSGGGSLHYAYDAVSRLTKITHADGSTQTYLYEDPLFFHALTSVVGPAGAILAHWAYDSRGRATTTTAGGEAGAVSLTYGDEDGALSATDAAGVVRRFRYRRVGDIDQVVATELARP